MEGFTDRAILVLPRYATYDTRPSEWKRLFRKSLQTLINYFEVIGIKVYSFNSDELSDELKLKGLNTYDVVTDEDKILLESFLLGGEKVPAGEEFPNEKEIFTEVRKKYPVKRGTSILEKKDVFIKRDKWITKQIIKNSSLVINCESPTKSYYKVESKAGDNRIVIQLNSLNFSVGVKLSGEPTDAVAIFNYVKAYSPLYTWEV